MDQTERPSSETILERPKSDEEMIASEPIDFRDLGIFGSRISMLRKRSFFTTEQGRFGFTSLGVRPDDVLCVFNGSQTPHVIRRVDDRDGEERYKLIGDAFVLDLMYGAADGMDVEEKTFVIV